jgi:ABC-type uncharacterized transport system permease subunit
MGSALLSYITLFGGALLYGAASVMFFIDIARAGNGRVIGEGARAGQVRLRKAPILLAAAGVFHFAYISSASFVAHVCPVDSVHFILSMIAVLATFFYIGARGFRRDKGRRDNLDALGLIIAPLGLAFLLGTYFVEKPVAGPTLGSGFIALHVIVNLVGIALFILAGAAATLYLVQERRLKAKRLESVKNLPPLDTLDRAEHRFLIAGFPLLTIGIVTGTFWSRQLEFGTPTEVMRIVFGYATWLLIAGVLLLRVAAGWRGRRSAYGTILGLICALGVLVVYLTRPSPAPVGDQAARSNAPVASISTPDER